MRGAFAMGQRRSNGIETDLDLDLQPESLSDPSRTTGFRQVRAAGDNDNDRRLNSSRNERYMKGLRTLCRSRMKADRSLRVLAFSSRRYQPDQVTSWRQSSNCRVLPVDVELAALG